MLAQFAIIFPEILLASLALGAQVVAAYCKNHSRQIASLTSIGVLGLVLFIIYFVARDVGFGGSFEVSPSISMFKAITLGLAALSLVVYVDLCNIDSLEVRMEFVTLVLLSTLGVFISISARDFLILFCGLELQALSGYALAAFNNKETKSSEAGLKYFILGALMSCIMLFGISFLYGYSGSIQFNEIRAALNNGEAGMNVPLVVGAVLMLSAILFKLSAAPVHIWTPDVYEGSPVAAVSYFSVAQKLGMLIVLINIMSEVIGDYTSISVTIIKVVAVLSMIVGSLGAIMQTSLKRLMAYSSVLNIGYVLVGICLNTQDGKLAAFVYMLIYAITSIGFFACLVALFGKHADYATFDDLRGIAASRKALAAVIAVFMFSFVGMPPFAGFFGKYYLFLNAVEEGEIILAIIGVLSSVVAAFYYLKVIKYMYFNELPEGGRIIPTRMGLMLVSTLSTIFVMFFFIFASSYIL